MPPRYAYGGQALIEGVLMRGRTALAVALRHPDGQIVWATERLDQGLRARRVLRLPFVRGLVLLYDTLVTGTRWLVRSATVAASAELNAVLGAIGGPLLLGIGPSTMPPPSESRPRRDDELPKGFGIAIGGMLLVTLAFGIALFFLLPLFIATNTVGRFNSGLGMQLTEGVVRVVIFVVYLLLIARAPDIQRVFQYHGAEHMSIHALEGGHPLTVEAARDYPTAHPRCGTEFLVVVLIISILVFALVGQQPPLWMILSRVALVPVIAAISYELLQFGARHRRHALVRWLWAPGIWVQLITTRQPSDDMIEVAIVSLERALLADGQAIPAGSTMFAARPLDPVLAADEEAAAAAAASAAAGEAGPETAAEPRVTGVEP